MKTNYNLTESEKKRVLKLHELEKKHFNFLHEQANYDIEKLKLARDKGCKLAVGGTLKTAPGLPPALFKRADYDSKNGYFKQGDELYVYANNTFDVVVRNPDGSVKSSLEGKPWSCKALEPGPTVQQQDDERLVKKYRDQGWKTIEDLRAANEDTRPSELQKKFETMQIGNTTLYKEKIIGQEQKYDTQKIKDWIVSQGYIVDPDDITLAQGGLTPYSLKDILGVDPTKYGLPTDYKIYKEPSGQNVQSRVNPVRQDIEKQEIGRKDCKDVIDTFYDFYKLDPRGTRSVDQKTSSLKPDVQSCVYQHYPTKLFGRNFNRKVEELAGLSSFTPQGKKYKIELP